MKKSVFCASILVVGFAFAGSTEFTCDNVLGVMPVSITNTQLILSVPWVQPGGGDAIAVSNFVKTAGLTNDDTLTWYDGAEKKYNIWKVDNGYWSSVESVEDKGIFEVDPGTVVLKQGNAVVLNRASSNETVYVIGQVGTNSTITTTVAAEAVSLIAPPGSLNAPFDVNAGIEYVDSAVKPMASVGDKEKNRITSYGDSLISANVGGLTASFVYFDGKWRPSYDITNDTISVKVPAGNGIWYKRKADTPMTIRWSANTIGN